jgi:hypothetical protein
MIDTILTNTTFQFNDRNYLQLTGTSMGTRMAPPYANLFMGTLDTAIIRQFPNTISFYKRFIDDIFFIFTGPIDIFYRYLDIVKTFMNNIHPTIKFTFNHSDTSIDFMDLTLYKDHRGRINSTLHRKPTDTMSLLHFKSYHPHHIASGLIHSQAMRYNRLISEPCHLSGELRTLARQLVLKGYHLDIINKNISKALRHTQKDLVNKIKIIDHNYIFPIVTPYNVQGKQINNIILHNWNIINNDPELCTLFPPIPTLTHTNTPTLRDRLIRTKYTNNPPE